VRFMSADDRQDDFLLSMGRSEQVFCLWKTDCVDESRERQAAGGAIRDTNSAQSSNINFQKMDASIGSSSSSSTTSGDDSEFAQKGRRRGKLGLLSWLSEAKEPSKLSVDIPTSAPPQRLTLKHVYG
jgi:hypothetical protein